MSLSIFPQSRPQVLLHLGMPKTATTLLQNELFAKHSQVLFVGKCNEWFAGHDASTRFRPRRLFEFSQELMRGRVDTAKYRETGRELVARAGAEEKLLVWSVEGLTAGAHDRKRQRAEAFHQLFGDAQVLIVLRQPFSFLTSYYLQQVQGYNLRNDSEAMTCAKEFPPPPHHFSIEEYLALQEKTPGRPAFTHLHFEETLTAFGDVFGRERITLLLFEQLCAEPEAFLRGLAEAVGIDAEEAARLAGKRRRNLRLTERHLANLDWFERTAWRRYLYRLAPNRTVRRRLLGIGEQLAASQAPPAVVEFPPAWRERIEQLTRGPLTRIAAEFNLPLAEYGYPVDTPASVRRAA